jgi:hypothetical protein
LALKVCIDWGIVALHVCIDWGSVALPVCIDWGIIALPICIDWGIVALPVCIDWGIVALPQTRGPKVQNLMFLLFVQNWKLICYLNLIFVNEFFTVFRETSCINHYIFCHNRGPKVE